MQKRITALNPGLISGAILSVLLHAGLFHEGWLNVSAFESKPPEVILDSGTIAVELTLMPSIASAPSTPEPNPEPQETEEVIDLPPEPVKEQTIEPIIPSPIPITDEPSIIQPQAAESPTPAKQETNPETQPDLPEPSMASIDQDGSMEEDKGAITEAVSQNTCKAAYPSLSRRRGEEGSVTLSFDISSSGKVSNIQIVKSSGHKRLDKAAVKAISGARFTPAEQFGKPIDSTLTQTFNFRLTQ